MIGRIVVGWLDGARLTGFDARAAEFLAIARDLAAVSARRIRLAAIAIALALAPAADAQPAQAEHQHDELDPILASALDPWTGDLDGMVARGMVRVAIPYGLSTYFIDGADQKGLTFDLVQLFESVLRKRYPHHHGKLQVVVIPTNRGRLLPMLLEGQADIAAGTLTITDQRRQLVDFGEPLVTGVREVLVTGPAAPDVKSADDLLPYPVHVRRSSSFHEHLVRLNEQRIAAGKPAFTVLAADENLTTDDLLEMVDAGLIPATVSDEPIARFFSQVFPKLVIHDNLALAENQQIAWAMRKSSPDLKALVDEFSREVRKGTRLGNILLSRHLKSARWVDNALAPENRAHFEHVAALLKTYAARYEFDWLMIAAQGYQESRLDQSKRSHMGAIGVMQIMPDTARDPNVNIPDIESIENNIHAGVKYLRFIRSRYFEEPSIAPLDRVLFSFAAYNAGPGNISKSRRQAGRMGLDPNVWLDNVEIAAAKVVSREPVVYVRNIYKYFVAYRLLIDHVAQAGAAGRAMR